MTLPRCTNSVDIKELIQFNEKKYPAYEKSRRRFEKYEKMYSDN